MAVDIIARALALKGKEVTTTKVYGIERNIANNSDILGVI